jgi:hypothetical protein
MSALSPSALSPSALSPSDLQNSRYEQACDQAIAMCDGNMRSTIKALIMANEYLETELRELQAAISSGCMPKGLSEGLSNSLPDEASPDTTGSAA